MLLALIFTACISGQCREVQIPWDGSLMQCMIFGGHQLAAWTNDHPGYVAKGWRCESGRPA